MIGVCVEQRGRERTRLRCPAAKPSMRVQYTISEPELCSELNRCVQRPRTRAPDGAAVARASG